MYYLFASEVTFSFYELGLGIYLAKTYSFFMNTTLSLFKCQFHFLYKNELKLLSLSGDTTNTVKVK